MDMPLRGITSVVAPVCPLGAEADTSAAAVPTAAAHTRTSTVAL
jgi:hypothetical protein